MRRLLLLAALCMALALAFPAPVLAQSASAAPEDYGAVTARGADTVPLNPDGTCPEGYVTVNAPFYAEESPNAAGRIFGYGEDDLASTSASVSVSASADPCPDPDFPRDTPDGCQASDLPDVEFGSASASARASASATAGEDLPDTGGPSPALTLVPLALLLGAGLVSLRVLRCG